MEQPKEYYAFISYKREDEKWAKWLADELKHYHLPTTLNGKKLPKNLRPIFRDTDELSAGNLPEQIYHALSISKNLIVVCSPHSAYSDWVDKEITDFIKIKGGKVDNIFPFIIEGVPFSKDADTECFPETLKNLPKNKEILGGNIHEQGGREAAVVKVIAGMLGIGFDSLWQKDQRERRRKKIMIICTAIIFALLSLGLFQYYRMLNINQSRLIAGVSIRLADEGDTYLAQMIALQALPPNQTLYTPEAEEALRYAYSKKFTKIKGHTDAVLSVCFSPDGKHIVSSSTDGTIKIWDASNGLCVDTLEEKTEYKSNTVEYSPNGCLIASTSDDGRVRLWNAETGTLISSFFNGRLEYRKIISTCFSPDGKYIAYVPLSDKTIQVRSVNPDYSLFKELISTSYINSVAFSPDGNNLVAATSSGKVEIWDLAKGECVKSLYAQTDRFNSACYSPDGKAIVTASADGLVRIWDVESGKCRECRGHDGPVLTASFSHDGNHVVSASDDRTVRIWDVNTGGHRILKGHNGSVYSASFSPDDTYIVSASEDQTIGLWCLTEERSVFSPRTSGSLFRYSNFSPDGKRFICGIKEDATPSKFGLYIWDIESSECVDTLHGHTKPIYSALFSNDGRNIVSASSDSTIRIWDVTSGKCNSILCKNAGIAHYASFSPDGRYIVSINTDSTIRIWNKTNGECINTIYDRAKYATFAPDNKRIAVASDSCIHLWKMSTGERLERWQQTDIVNSVSFSPNGKYLVAALEDGTVRILNAHTGICLKTLKCHGDCAYFASFSTDGKYIVCVSSDYTKTLSEHTTQIWGVSTGLCIKSFKAPFIKAHSSFFSPDNRYIATLTMNRSNIWSFPSLQDLIDQTRERFKDRQLTLEEKRKYYIE